MRNGFRVGGPFHRPLARFSPPFDRSFREACMRQMMPDDLWLGVCNRWELVAQGLGDACVQHLETTLEQALIGSVPHQRVLEAVDGFRRLAAAEHDFRMLELGECTLQIVAAHQRAQQGIGELAPDGGTDLTAILSWRQTVDRWPSRTMGRCRSSART